MKNKSLRKAALYMSVIILLVLTVKISGTKIVENKCPTWGDRRLGKCDKFTATNGYYMFDCRPAGTMDTICYNHDQ